MTGAKYLGELELLAAPVAAGGGALWELSNRLDRAIAIARHVIAERDQLAEVAEAARGYVGDISADNSRSLDELVRAVQTARWDQLDTPAPPSARRSEPADDEALTVARDVFRSAFDSWSVGPVTTYWDGLSQALDAAVHAALRTAVRPSDRG